VFSRSTTQRLATIHKRDQRNDQSTNWPSQHGLSHPPHSERGTLKLNQLINMFVHKFLRVWKRIRVSKNYIGRVWLLCDQIVISEQTFIYVPFSYDYMFAERWVGWRSRSTNCQTFSSYVDMVFAGWSILPNVTWSSFDQWTEDVLVCDRTEYFVHSIDMSGMLQCWEKCPSVTCCELGICSLFLLGCRMELILFDLPYLPFCTVYSVALFVTCW